MGVVQCRSCSLMWGTHRLAHRPRPSGQGTFVTRTLWIPVHSHINSNLCCYISLELHWCEIQSQRCRLYWICSWFLSSHLKSSWNWWSSVHLAHWKTRHSLKMPICWDWGRISFVCAGVLDEGLQKVLVIVCHVQQRKPKWQTAL